MIVFRHSVSCKSGLEKKYSKSSKEKDLIEISEQISPKYLKLLTDYISKLETQQPIDGKTYKNLLSDAKYEEIKRELEIDDKKQIKKEKDSIFKVEKVKKTKILCARKWRMKEYSFVLETSEKLSGIKMTDEVFKNENKGWKKYSNDGTFKTNNGITGTWKFVNINKIRETSRSLLGKEVFFLEIKVLDKNTFHYLKRQFDSTDYEGKVLVRTSEVMKSI